MVTPRHDKDGFFKYYTADSAKRTLENTTRKWSTPFLFNDPFDNQFDLAWQEPTEELAVEQNRKLMAMLTAPEPFKPNQFGELTRELALVRAVCVQNPEAMKSDELEEMLTREHLRAMKRIYKDSPQFSAEVRAKMTDTSIFCLSESRDNLLLWSHYASDHAGVAIKFLSLQSVDSPLMVAQPVRYSRALPRLEYDMFFNHNAAVIKTMEVLTLTKSEVWAYEREWRVVTTLRDKRQKFEILPYAPEEVGEVYLGCRISPEDRDSIIEVVRRKYPWAKIMQAEKHPTEFALVFRPL